MAKTDTLTIRIKPEIKTKLFKIAEAEHRSAAQQIEYWIANYKLNEQKK